MQHEEMKQKQQLVLLSNRVPNEKMKGTDLNHIQQIKI